VRLSNKLEVNLVLSRNAFFGIYFLLRTNKIKLRKSLTLSKNRKLRKKLLLKRRMLIAKNSELVLIIYYLLFIMFLSNAVIYALSFFSYTGFIPLPCVT
jgi:Na+/melibiose symporter-like transporter